MPWSGAGVFNRIYSWVADAAAGIDITASRTDDDTDDITSNGFGNTLTRDGQGSATANLPMNGFRHTNCGAGVNPTDYVVLSQLTSAAVASLGDVKQTSLPESLLPTLAPGWYVCAGQTRPRTDPLWLKTGAVSGANWAYGTGDGTTTYTLPDAKGRVGVGKDNMGGTAANRVTAGVSGIGGSTLAATGGDQHAQQDTITTSGSITASSSATSTPSESPHTHSYTAPTSTGTQGTFGANANFTQGTSATTGSAVTGLTVATTVTTSITNGLTYNSGLQGASQNMPPAIIFNTIIYCGA